MNNNTNLYVSPELAEVIDLVLERQDLLRHIKIVGSDEYLKNEQYHLIVADCMEITNKLEAMVVKDTFTTDKDLR